MLAGPALTGAANLSTGERAMSVFDYAGSSTARGLGASEGAAQLFGADAGGVSPGQESESRLQAVSGGATDEVSGLGAR